MSTTRLLVLGVVRLFQPVHGYVVRRELVTWRAADWASVKPGSIYNALKTLTNDGFLEIVGTDQVGGRPERTTYQLTTGGEEEFRNLLREEWWTVRSLVDPLMSALSFIGSTAREEAIAALEHRATTIRGMVRHLEMGIADIDGLESPLHVREMMRLMNARMQAEIDWSAAFVARLRAGEYSTKGDPDWQPSSVKTGEAGKARKRKAARKDASASAKVARTAIAKARETAAARKKPLAAKPARKR